MMTKLKEYISDLCEVNSAYSRIARECFTEFQNACAKHKKLIEELNKKIEQLEKEKEEANKNNEMLKRQINENDYAASLRNELSKVSGNVSQLNEALSGHISRSEENRDALSSRIENVSEELNSNAQTIIGNQNRNIDDVLSRLSELSEMSISSDEEDELPEEKALPEITDDTQDEETVLEHVDEEVSEPDDPEKEIENAVKILRNVKAKDFYEKVFKRMDDTEKLLKKLVKTSAEKKQLSDEAKNEMIKALGGKT